MDMQAVQASTYLHVRTDTLEWSAGKRRTVWSESVFIALKKMENTTDDNHKQWLSQAILSPVYSLRNQFLHPKETSPLFFSFVTLIQKLLS